MRFVYIVGPIAPVLPLGWLADGKLRPSATPILQWLADGKLRPSAIYLLGLCVWLADGNGPHGPGPSGHVRAGFWGFVSAFLLPLTSICIYQLLD